MKNLLTYEFDELTGEARDKAFELMKRCCYEMHIDSNEKSILDFIHHNDYMFTSEGDVVKIVNEAFQVLDLY